MGLLRAVGRVRVRGADPRGPCSRTVSHKSPGPQPTHLRGVNIRPFASRLNPLCIRVSVVEAADPSQNAIEAQRTTCEHYVRVQREKGRSVACVHEDAGHSGKDMHRPGMRQLIADVRSGRVEVIVAQKIDRVSRSLRDMIGFLGVLEQAGATYVAATQSFDTSTSAGALLLKGLIRCGHCGSTMAPFPSGKTGPSGERFLYYQCSDAIKRPHHCDCPVRRLPARKIDDAVARILMDLVRDPTHLQQSREQGH
jgi:hypothetical protein